MQNGMMHLWKSSGCIRHIIRKHTGIPCRFACLTIIRTLWAYSVERILQAYMYTYKARKVKCCMQRMLPCRFFWSVIATSAANSSPSLNSYYSQHVCLTNLYLLQQAVLCKVGIQKTVTVCRWLSTDTVGHLVRLYII